MENEDSKQKWWQTIPVILTGITSLIGAITALVIALNPITPTAAIASQSTHAIIAGKWHAPDFTSDADKVIYFEDLGGGSVRGHYNASQNAKIVRGYLSEKELSAIWVENSSKVECSTEIEGSPYWGKVEIKFEDGFKMFKGWWGYCNDKPTNLFDGKKL